MLEKSTNSFLLIVAILAVAATMYVEKLKGKRQCPMKGLHPNGQDRGATGLYFCNRTHMFSVQACKKIL